MNISPGPLDFQIKRLSTSTWTSKFLNAGAGSRICELSGL